MKNALTPSEIADALRDHSDWHLHDGKLVREWHFATFPEAISFVDRVALLAEEAGHHPDIDIRYTHVKLGLISHDAGGITHRDVAMAGKITAKFP